MPAASHIRAYMKRMSAEPHHAGSPGSRAVAEYALGLFKEWGIDARIETYEALIPYPITRVLESAEPSFRARASEPPIGADGAAGLTAALPPYNAYSADGDVTAPLLYVNYGAQEDYDHLSRLGLDARGKIVIVRYGRVWRGSKVKLAAEHGAVGCIIYSDPRDDGYFQGDVYPLGPFRPPQGVQRGSVMDMPLYVGDPLSPGWASEPGSKRLPLSEATVLMKIPVMPISYEDASGFLRHLTGPVAPPAWRGALGLTYHVGPGPVRAHLKVQSDWATRPVHNVIATIPGAEFPDQWVLYGNHHDAWVLGANDPVSGASALLEAARSLAELRKTGWQPKRTIQFALWDAEEFGLIGSTEWLEKHQNELDRKLVVYLNSDSNGKGRIAVGGSHSLELFVEELLRSVHDPESDKPLLEPTARRRTRRTAAPPRNREAFHLTPLGAGSDYVAFLSHGGIASLNLGFGGETGGIYHSAYDNFDWYTRFADVDFTYGRAFSELMASMLLRFADAPLLPFDFSVPASTIQRYVREVSREAGGAASKLDLRELREELERMAISARAFESEYTAALRRWPNLPPAAKVAEVNEALYRTERTLLSAAGLPGRNWYKHQLYAPAMYSGYTAKTLPAVRESVEAARWDDANQAIRELLKSVRAMHAEVIRITVMLRGL